MLTTGKRFFPELFEANARLFPRKKHNVQKKLGILGNFVNIFVILIQSYWYNPI